MEGTAAGAAEQPTLPGMSDRDMAWLDPEIARLAFECNLGELSSGCLLAAVKIKQAEIAASREKES